MQREFDAQAAKLAATQSPQISFSEPVSLLHLLVQQPGVPPLGDPDHHSSYHEASASYHKAAAAASPQFEPSQETYGVHFDEPGAIHHSSTKKVALHFAHFPFVSRHSAVRLVHCFVRVLRPLGNDSAAATTMTRKIMLASVKSVSC